LIDDESDWRDGTSRDWLRQFAIEWKSQDWGEIERELNQMRQFTLRVDSIRIHYIHETCGAERSAGGGGNGSRVFPILLLHGWPSTCFEFRKLIAVIRDANRSSRYATKFDVIAPSIPGFLYSETKAGLDVKRVARVLCAFMKALNYDHYGVHGGDWGALVAAYMSKCDVACAALHLGMVLVDVQHWRVKLDFLLGRLDRADRIRVADLQKFDAEETAYAELHCSRPNSVAFALADSPVGLAAYLAEKWRSWSDPRARASASLLKRELMIVASLYWFSGCVATSLQLYRESRLSGRWAAPDDVFVPVAHSRFKHDIVQWPQRWAKRHYNIVRWKEHEIAGHFPALEAPQLLAHDLLEFFSEYAQ
jgi:pimeloyl-ACP methyl ester carboxylesterase